ncbi:hypothetical protein ccbrp13_38180 [Ktedonobacteria bacterium brp13]|nr:hypothetical protein ccbrp13_38180 [Ktedonobacteria bacterium brp13]
MGKDTRCIRIFVKHYINPILRNLAIGKHGPQEYHFQKPTLIDKKAGFAALPSPIRQILQLLGAQYFVKLPISL